MKSARTGCSFHKYIMATCTNKLNFCIPLATWTTITIRTIMAYTIVYTKSSLVLCVWNCVKEKRSVQAESDQDQRLSECAHMPHQICGCVQLQKSKLVIWFPPMLHIVQRLANCLKEKTQVTLYLRHGRVYI